MSLCYYFKILIKLFLVIIGLVFVRAASNIKILYITSSQSNNCPPEWSADCLTLSELATNISNYLATNSTLFLLEGNHSLITTFTASNKDYLRILTLNASITASIICSTGVDLKFINITQLNVSGVNFIRCSGTIELVNHFTLEYSSFQHAYSSSALQLIQTHAKIVGSSFTFNTVGILKNISNLPYFVSISYYSYRELAIRYKTVSVRVGGALVVTHSNVAISNSLFDSNGAQLGGAIFSQAGSNITANKCIFLNNIATCIDRKCSGGAWFIGNGCTIIAHQNIFHNNTSEYSGGAIASLHGNLFDYENIFSSNQARTFGGAIAATHRSVIVITGSNFTSNTAGVVGGTAFITRGLLSIDSSFLNKNRASDGGVVYASSSNVTIICSLLDGNSAGNDGGVIFASSNSIIIIHQVFLDKNEATDHGGAIFASSSSITVNNSFLDNNNASSNGGVVYAYSSNVYVHNSSLDKNVAENGGNVYAFSSTIHLYNSTFGYSNASRDGGAMFAHFSSVYVQNSSFDSNKANSGGVMFATYSSSILLYGSSSHFNEAKSGAVVYASSSSVTINNSSFGNNESPIGGVVHTLSSNIVVQNSSFDSNVASFSGGVVYASFSSLSVYGSSFNNNEANFHGGFLQATYCGSILLYNSSFVNNQAHHDGGVVDASFSTLTVHNCLLKSNEAGYSGGVVFASSSHVILNMSYFLNNKGNSSGGVMFKVENERRNTKNLFIGDYGTIVNSCRFVNNTAVDGGVFSLNEASMNITDSIFINNTAGHIGGALLVSNKLSQNYTLRLDACEFGRNKAIGGGAITLIGSTTTLMGFKCTFVGNRAQYGGAIHASESQVHILIQSLLMANNTAKENGGAIYLSISDLNLVRGNSTLIRNRAYNGGAVYTYESKILLEAYSQTKLIANSANNYGGGLYLMNSELKVRGYVFNITGNIAEKTGGGLYTVNSSIVFGESTQFTNNLADNGAGIGLAENTYLSGPATENISIINFNSNRAIKHGGALFVEDGTYRDMCVAINTHNVTSTNKCFSNLLSITFSNNSAGESGSNLFGGLLDRCKVDNELLSEKESEIRSQGLDSFLRASNIRESQVDTISSYPVRLCFCRKSIPDCDYQPGTIEVNRGNKFSLQVIAFDQVHSPVNSTVHCSLNSSAGGLDVGQDTQRSNTSCTELNFTLFSPNNQEQLTLSVDGPCNVPGFSERNVMIEISCVCPIGFEISSSNERSCICMCADVLQPYVKSQCDVNTQSIIRKDSFWITFVNYSQLSGYVIYPYCPFDYCHLPEENVLINLNLPNGADAQCVSHRSGTLCGSCQPGFSVSLGSSACLHCPPYWPGLMFTITLAFILSGICLVALLLFLNMTVAIGTLNALIFYANIVAANKSTLLSTSKISFSSIFISWFNFDLGFDTCFFNGMDTYVKMWLQLAFPTYIILLVCLIIKLSYHFKAFGNLIGQKDPVATLASLILLSYSKLLQTVIAGFSSAILNYPDGSKVSIWLPDATHVYLSGRHAVLFTVAILILLAGLMYTLHLFMWQWILQCPRKRVKWIRFHKLSSFIETHHIPYVSRHRYWTGLLLFVRIIVYIISAFNTSGDPKVTLLSTVLIMTCLLVYIGMFGVTLYKSWFINAMEIIVYFNLTVTCCVTLYVIDTDMKQQEYVSNISVSITFVQLLLVIAYHIIRFACKNEVYTRFSHTFIYKKEIIKIARKQNKIYHKAVEIPNEEHQVYELLDAIDSPVTHNYNVSLLQVEDKPDEPTKSVVILPMHQAEQPLALSNEKEDNCKDRHSSMKEKYMNSLSNYEERPQIQRAIPILETPQCNSCLRLPVMASTLEMCTPLSAKQVHTNESKEREESIGNDIVETRVTAYPSIKTKI